MHIENRKISWTTTAWLLLAKISTAALLAGVHYETIKSLGVRTTGTHPAAPLIVGSDGALYGTTVDGGGGSAGTVFQMNADGSAYHVLHQFNRDGMDGLNPSAALVEGRDQALYGTTTVGGRVGFGTIFKLNKDGTGYQLLIGLIQKAITEPRGLAPERTAALNL